MQPLDFFGRNDFHQDDDEIVLVSSTRERWEKLHGIERTYGRGPASNVDDEDDLVMVAVKPAFKRPLHSWRKYGLMQPQIVFAAFAVVVWVIRRFWIRRKPGEIDKGNKTTATASSTTATNDSRDDPIVTPESETVVQNPSSEGNTNSLSLQLSSSQLSVDNRQGNSTTGMIQQQQKQTQTRQLAQHFANDVKLVQQVLQEHSLDPSLAPQLAMSLQSSQQIVDSQRELSYRTALLDAHQRSLDRQRSEEFHREHLQGARYDPDWKGKLQQTRDRSYCWSGGVGRLWWEVLVVQQLVVRVVPIWKTYFYRHQEHDMGLMVRSMLKETVGSVLSQVCGCEVPGSSLLFPLRGTDSIASLEFILTNTLNRILQTPQVQFWACHGYCAIGGFILLCCAVLCHQGLRILSMPPFLHHVVNLVAMAVFVGPQRMLAWIVVTVLRMFLVVPGDRGEEFEPQIASSAQVGCSVMLLGLWVLLPLWSWRKTSSLYRKAVQAVAMANPVDFETSFRNATSQLEHWHREQLALRYLALSIYSALVLWETTSHHTNY